MKKRNAAIDIARGLSIFLIVLSHTNFHYSYFFTFFYVQVFFFLSGVFHKKDVLMKDGLYRKTKGLMYPYVFFGVAYSCIVLLLGRATISDIHIYDPDSFDNGPQWFLITLYVLTIVCMLLNELFGKFSKILVGGGVIFLSCFYLFSNKIDDYTDIAKAGVSLPFFAAGTLYLKHQDAIGRWKKTLFAASLCLVVLFVYVFPTNIGVRHLVVSCNVIQYLAASFSGIALILSASLVLSELKVAKQVLSFWGEHSLFILCLHWPIVRVLYDMVHITESDWATCLICVALCSLCSSSGLLLKRYVPFVFG